MAFIGLWKTGRISSPPWTNIKKGLCWFIYQEGNLRLKYGHCGKLAKNIRLLYLSQNAPCHDPLEFSACYSRQLEYASITSNAFNPESNFYGIQYQPEMGKQQNRKNSKRNAKISLKRRQRLIALVMEKGFSIGKASDRVGIKLSTAKLIVLRFKRTGTYHLRKEDKEEEKPCPAGTQNTIQPAAQVQSELEQEYSANLPNGNVDPVPEILFYPTYNWSLQPPIFQFPSQMGLFYLPLGFYH